LSAIIQPGGISDYFPPNISSSIYKNLLKHFLIAAADPDVNVMSNSLRELFIIPENTISYFTFIKTMEKFI
jgi:hypothetical protein